MVGFKALLSKPLKAAAILFFAGAICFGFARMLDIAPWSWLYQNKFSFIPGHWLRSQLNTAMSEPQDTCILVGASVVREGFDSNQLSQGVSGVRFVNLATTGGSSPMDVLDIQSRILAKAGDRYKCIVVGMNHFYMRRFDDSSYELVKTDYLSQLPLEALINPAIWQGGSNKKSLLNRLIVPFGRNSVVAQRWWRLGLFWLRNHVSRRRVEIINYEASPHEFRPAVQFQYLGKPSIFDQSALRARALIEKNRLLSRSSYDDSEVKDVMRRVMERLSGLSDHVIVVNMPLSSGYRTVEEVAMPAYDEARKSLGGLRFMNCQIDPSEERSLFYDTSHLNEWGRERLSNSLAPMIADIVHGAGLMRHSDLCAAEYP